MTQEHPITPPPELLQEWCQQGHNCISELDALKELATEAARWGADEELQACINWLYENDWKAVQKHLRDARRPKPSSLKEQALETLRSMQIEPCWINGINTNAELMSKYDILRRALESLPD